MLRVVVLALLVASAFLATYTLARSRSGKSDPPMAGPAGMRWIPPGEFTMGDQSKQGWPDESPAHRVRLDGFWIDEHEVTNSQFRAFVEATGYLTTAEKAPDLAAIMAQVPPGTPPPKPEDLVPASMVFRPTVGPVPLDDYSRWWAWTPGASWKHPEGPGSDLKGRDDHPVVQVSWDDAAAYARWAGKRLPTEAEWERAARGGLEGQPYTWGSDEPGASGRWQANIWQGEFPSRNTAVDGFPRTAPVGSYPPNGYGLTDMAGNVWEWCADSYQPDIYRARGQGGPVANPTGPANSPSPLRVQRGGSFLCNPSYCSRYRPSARQGCGQDTGMSHLGFRCATTGPAR